MRLRKGSWTGPCLTASPGDRGAGVSILDSGMWEEAWWQWALRPRVLRV